MKSAKHIVERKLHQGLNVDPVWTWASIPARALKKSQDPRVVGQKLLTVTYGYNLLGDKNKPATCLMREDIFRSLMNGTLMIVRSSNDLGFDVVDKQTLLVCPKIQVGNYTVL